MIPPSTVDGTHSLTLCYAVLHMLTLGPQKGREHQTCVFVHEAV